MPPRRDMTLDMKAPGISLSGRRKKTALIPAVLTLGVLTLLSGPQTAEQRVEHRSIGPGCRYTWMTDSERELAVFFVTVDLHHPRITIQPVTAEDLPHQKETVPAMALRLDRPGRHIIAAVNADFFAAGRPVGLCITGGRLLKTGRGWSSLTFSMSKIPFIGRLRPSMILIGKSGVRVAVHGFNVPKGDAPAVLFSRDFYRLLSVRPGRKYFVLSPALPGVPAAGSRIVRVWPAAASREAVEIPPGRWILMLDEAASAGLVDSHIDQNWRLEVHMQPDLLQSDRPQPDRPQAWHAVSGGPRLLRRGRISVEREAEGQRRGFDTERHPRTAAGYSRDGRYLILTVVDGRQPGYSRGVDLFELAELMQDFGCSEAVNLDGGGSSTLVIRHEVVNRPSDPTGPRPVANALVVVQTGPAYDH